MAAKSAGILLFRYRNQKLEVFLVHPGGPFWAKKDTGCWSIPKGEFKEDETPLSAAQREFREETGFNIEKLLRRKEFIALAPLKQPGGKTVHAWAAEGDCDASTIRSNTFRLEWPPHSGKQAEYPEVDRAEWFPVRIAYEKILKGQTGFLDQLCVILDREE
ncbi:NUDIX domain-containing protein [Desulfopila inferna]|uniref:NUDIX domain-containing protein n=1 Tax=Desulfopila inferna TaxID=468528 RepID=UPI00196685EC|nr:NUDIX domain-containing protein [Desulfopila inferna]MBM9604708.1 NUDIX domain-containing protein [Desulfopila inferna]